VGEHLRRNRSKTIQRGDFVPAIPGVPGRPKLERSFQDELWYRPVTLLVMRLPDDPVRQRGYELSGRILCQQTLQNTHHESGLFPPDDFPRLGHWIVRASFTRRIYPTISY